MVQIWATWIFACREPVSVDVLPFGDFWEEVQDWRNEHELDKKLVNSVGGVRYLTSGFAHPFRKSLALYDCSYWKDPHAKNFVAQKKMAMNANLLPVIDFAIASEKTNSGATTKKV